MVRGVIALHRRGPGRGPCAMSYEPIDLLPPPAPERPQRRLRSRWAGYDIAQIRHDDRLVPGVRCPTCKRWVALTPRGKIRIHPRGGTRCPTGGQLAVYPDALDGLPTMAHERVSFGLDDDEYLIDLSAANATRLRETLQPYLAAARRVRRAA